MRHVLVVDDMVETCRLVAALVSRCGHRATWATSGEEALAALARNPADLVLLDAMMPGMDGAEVLRRIRSDATTATVPVVVFSAVADPQFRQHMLDEGANDYWVKAAFDFAQLQERLKPYLPC
jgi:two-component system cell cycle response regulator